MDRNKKTKRNAIIALSVGLPIYTFIFLMFFFNHGRSSSWHINMVFDLLCLSLIPVAIIVMMVVIVICVNGARYKSIEDEVNDERSENPETSHDVLTVLSDNEKETYVLACFHLDDIIRPAVYNKYGKRLTSIDLHTSIISYKKVYPIPNLHSKDANIRVMRLRNKRSKSQMIFFATKLANANLLFDGREPERYECGDLGGLTVFGCPYTKDSKPELTVNGTVYPLKQTLVDFMFIAKQETEKS